MNEQELDQILNDMGQDEPSAAEVAAAKARVWQRLTAGAACEQFREQFAAYRAGELREGQRMLLEDHLTRCAGCRRAFNGASTVVEMPAAVAPRRRLFAPKWAIAAGLAAVGLFLGRNAIDQALAPGGPRATVAGVTGALYGADASLLRDGATIGDGDVVRTAAGTRAQLRLADGSLVEVNERTELAVKAAWSGATIQLDRGDIIVRAAKQRNGYLKVVTRDSEAAVKGTIFTVSAGTAGSLVGVVEGSVAVTQTGGEKLLKPGEQAATSEALQKVSVREAVAWSSEREKHFALLAELAAIEKQLPAPAPRTAGRIVKMLPPDMEVYAAIPNLGPTVMQAVSLIEQRSRDNEVLREWWASRSAGEMKGLIDRLRVLSPMLGDEFVFVLSKAGTEHVPLMLAEVKGGQETALTAELAKLLPAPAAYRVANGLMAVSDSTAHLNDRLAALGQGTATPFGQELAKRYGRGVAWIVGLNVMGMDKKPPVSHVGVDNIKFLFAEQRTVDGNEENEGTVMFDGPRTGMAAWLAGPGAAGSAEYASADAVAVFSAATRNPRQIMEEMLGFAPEFGRAMAELEAKTGVNAMNDIAAALGTDFTLSVETAAVPLPGWFAAVEVYQPATLNATIARLTDTYNKQAEEGRKLVLKQETVEGRVWHSLTLSGFGLQWTFDRGYWIVGMDRAVVGRALATRAGGFPLVRSAAFRGQMPTLAGVAHPSGFAWINTGEAAALLQGFAKGGALEKFAAVREPSLVTFNGFAEQIQVASRTRLTSLMLETMLQGGASVRKRVK